MNRPHPIATLLSALTPAPYAWGALSAALLVLQRVLLVAIAVQLVLSTRTNALFATALLAAIFAARGAVRGMLRVRARMLLQSAAVSALLTGDVVQTSPLREEDAQNAVHEGTHKGIHLISDTLPNVLGDAIAALGLGVYVAVVQPSRVVLLGGVALVVAALAVVATRRLTQTSTARASRAYSPVFEDLLAALGARLELVANGKDSAFLADAEKRIAEYHRVAARSERLSAAAGRAPMLAAVIAVAAVLLIDRSLRGPAGATSLQDVATFATIVPAFLGLAQSAHDVLQNTAGVRPLADLLRGARRLEEGRAPIPPLPAHIAWRSVKYAYPRPDGAPGAPVLAGLSIDWHPGQILLLAGPNGSGKSTCVRLLLGLAHPQHGAITVSGKDLLTLDLAEWRRQIAYLPQRPFLPERATVRDAMKLLARDAGDATLRAALERIDVWRTLGARGESPLDVRIGTLSAGQRQRVAVARVLAMDAPLLILDEPDANLDAEGIRLIAAILRELAATRMVAVIAHTDQLIALGDTLVQLSAAA